MLEVSIRKKDELSYLIEVLESSEGYMLDDYKFVGHLTRLDGRTFLIASNRKRGGKVLPLSLSF